MIPKFARNWLGGRNGLALLAVAFLAFGVQPVFAADEKLDAATEKLDEALKKKDSEGAQSAIDELIGLWIDADGADDDATKKTVVSSLSKVLKWRGEDPMVIVKGAQALGDMGEDAAKPLVAATKDSKLRKDEKFKPALLQCIRALGATRSERNVKTLTSLLKDKDFEVIAVAGEALGNFDSRAKLRTRKMVAEELIKTLTSAYGATESDPRNTTLRQKYEIISIPILTALQRVTGASVGTPPEWRKWYNDNKKKRWN